MGNASDCPSSPPISDFGGDIACTVSEGQSCAYWWQENNMLQYAGCTCFEKDQSSKFWKCFRAPGLELRGPINACPMVEPESNTDCFGHLGTNCPFPRMTSCECSSSTQTLWKCVDLTLPPAGLPSTGPSTVSEDKPIKDLSDAEAQAWCEWFPTAVNGVGTPPPIEGPVSSDGYVNVGATIARDFFAGVCVPTGLAVSHCKANLKLFPCEATVGELTDCVLTGLRYYPAVHGCGRFLARANCEGTIVRRLGGGTGMDASWEGCDRVKVR